MQHFAHTAHLLLQVRQHGKDALRKWSLQLATLVSLCESRSSRAQSSAKKTAERARQLHFCGPQERPCGSATGVPAPYGSTRRLPAPLLHHSREPRQWGAADCATGPFPSPFLLSAPVRVRRTMDRSPGNACAKFCPWLRVKVASD